MIIHKENSISVVICSYTVQRWEELLAAVASVRSQTLPANEIIVVVDHNPLLLRRLQEQCLDVIVIENREKQGLSGARNSGWRRAQGEIIAFLDDDAIAEPTWIENLVPGYADANVVGVGGKIIPLWKETRPSWFPAEFNWVIGCTYFGMPAKNARIRNVIGANMSIRRSTLVTAGGFRESFGCEKGNSASQKTVKWLHHYAGDEETEFCIRVSQELPNSVWLYANLACVHHQVSIDRTRLKYFLWRCYDEGLGKASLVKLHHTSTGLSSEREYTFKALPKGVVRNIRAAFFHWEVAGLARASAIFIGLFSTVVGYCIGTLFLHSQASENKKREAHNYSSQIHSNPL